MQGGTRGQRGGTSHGKEEDPGARRGAGGDSIKQHQAEQQAAGKAGLAATAASAAAAAGSTQQAAWASSGQPSAANQQRTASTASSHAGGTGRRETSAPASQKGPPFPSIFEEWASSFKRLVGRPVWRENERGKNAVTYPQPKTNQTH